MALVFAQMVGRVMNANSVVAKFGKRNLITCAYLHVHRGWSAQVPQYQ